jgi:phage terminase small subunit
MPMLSNSRHEAFAHAIARGQSIDAAYVDAGYLRNSGNASRLNGKESVIARVVELKALVQNMRNLSTHRVVLTEAWVIQQLIGVVIDAKARDRPDSAGITVAAKRERLASIMAQIGDGGFGKSHLL